jgi:Cu+-exporting ATPase
MAKLQTLEVPVKGMDCAECTQHVRGAISKLDGVQSVDVLLASEKAIVQLDPQKVSMPAIRRAVASAGDYFVPEGTASGAAPQVGDFNRRLLALLALVFGSVLAIIVAGEWLGLFDLLGELVPFPAGLIVVLAAGWPVFRNVVRATLRRQIISHTLMTIGALAALIVGEWVTALIVVIFMRVGDYVENFTTESARRTRR